MKQVFVVGGQSNNTLNKWLEEIGVGTYVHYGLCVEDISPSALQEYGYRLYNNIPITAMVISVGNMADKILNLAFMLHGTLPDTRTKDKKLITQSLLGCKNYLTLRRYYGTDPGPTTS